MRGTPSHKQRVPYTGKVRILYDNAAGGPGKAKQTRRAREAAVLELMANGCHGNRTLAEAEATRIIEEGKGAFARRP
jgi:hypothetical protein